MRTAIVSDLHLGAATGVDLLRSEQILDLLLDEIADADRLVLLGDTLELRELPLARVLEATKPFFERLGEAMSGREVLLLPGNHDHRLAEPLLDRISLSQNPQLGLERSQRPSGGAASRIARLLGEAKLRIAYPGIWLRDDVYATHGHYMDCHLTLPRLECLAVATAMRLGGRPPDPADADDYERILRPIYGFAYGLAQSGIRNRAGPASVRAWTTVTAGRGNGGRRQAAVGAGARAMIPAAVRAVNRALDADFQPDLSTAAISRDGIAAAAELARRLRIDARHVLTGHTHRAGPGPDEQPWRIPGGGFLHNTGNWVFAAALHDPDARPGLYWPGTVTWLEGEDDPRRVELLRGHDAAALTAATAGRRRLSSS